MVSLAQITPAIPEGTPVFTVTYRKDGAETVAAAAIRPRGSGFIEIFDPLALPPQLELIRDEPWNGYPTETVLKQNVRNAEREPDTARKTRYSNSGFEKVPSASGEVWISVETAARRAKMESLQDALSERQEAARAAVAVEAPASTDDAPQGPGLFTLWGRHIAVAAIALLAVVVTVKVCF
jgi:hypothetical protein